MINRREIIDAGTIFNLNPHVIEKDMVLGWVLAGIYAHEELTEKWVFKGGTCLKKCYFETYRFSEDLDFTLIDAAQIDQTFLSRVFGEIGAWIYDQTGIDLPADSQDFDIYKNPRGSLSVQGRLTYRGPISPSSGSPRLKLDLTADEKIVLPPVRVPIFHPYSDAPENGIHVLAYAYEEAFGEKIRALAERTRPRDLYDVINLFRNERARPSSSVLLDVLQQKCTFKGIRVPKYADIEAHKTELQGGWANMLAHQLPALPPLDVFWDVLPDFFVWLEGGEAPSTPAVYTLATGETVLRDRTLRLSLPSRALSALEIIRFAASNRLRVELDYNGSTRRIEPYSLRRTSDGNIVLHAVNADKGEHRSYRVDRIAGARATNQTFVPRHEIELTPDLPLQIKLAAERSPSPLFAGVQALRTPRPSSQTTGLAEPIYVYECSHCGKRLNRRTQSSQLNAHKNKHGTPCFGRLGLYVDTKY